MYLLGNKLKYLFEKYEKKIQKYVHQKHFLFHLLRYIHANI